MAPEGSRKGLVAVVLALVTIAGGIIAWKSLGGDGEQRASGGGAKSSVKGRGTTWLEEETSTDPSGVIEGLVLDADGKPVDGAVVTLGRKRERNEEIGAGLSFMQPKGVATTAGGRFRIDALVPGTYTATATAQGWAPAHRDGIVVKARETATVELKLAGGGFLLSGKISDVGGGLVGGAKVTLSARNVGISRAPTLYRAVADGDGKYAISLARGNYGLIVEADGYATAMNDSVFVARPATKDVRLVPAARVAGRVVERGSKQPIAEAEVTLTSANRMDFRPPREVKANADGQFTFTGVEPGTFELMARKGPLVGVGKTVAVAVAQGIDGLEVEVDRGFTVSGRVKDEKGAPIPDLRIQASRDTPPFGQAARTRANSDGTYALEGMLPGTYRLGVYEEGYGYGRATAKVLAADVLNVDITVPAAVKVAGRVLTAKGQPVEGARVQARIEMRSGGREMSTGDMAVTAADGTYELRRAMAGRIALSARHETLGNGKVEPQELRSGEQRTFDIRLAAGGTISGVVRTEDGRPAQDVRISMVSRDPTSGMFMDVQDVTGPDGRYQIAAVPAGRLTVIADRRGRFSWGDRDEPHQKTLVMAEGEQKTGVDLTIPDTALSIKGTVVSSDGKPVAGAIITPGLERNGRAFRGSFRNAPSTAYSDMDGAFTIEEVSKGPFTLWASHPEHPDAEVKGVAGGASDVKVQLPAGALIAGTVVSPDGKPIPHYTMTILPGPASSSEKPEEMRMRRSRALEAPTLLVQDPGGAFEVRRLVGGNHELLVTTAGGDSANHVVALAAGEKKSGVRIQVKPGLRVTGRVVEHGTNKPLAAITVNVFGAAEARAEGTAGADGAFIIEGAPFNETIRVSARADDTRWVPETKEVEVKAGQTTIDAGIIRLLPGNFRERMMGDSSERGEIGASVRPEPAGVVLGTPRPDTPAAKAGLKRGDIVLAIDKLNTADLGRSALGYLTAGKPGSTVELTVQTPGGQPRTVTLTREAWRPTPPPPTTATGGSPPGAAAAK